MINDYLSTDLINDFVVGLFTYLPRVIGAFFLVLFGRFIAKKLKKLLIRIISKTGVDRYGESLNDIDFIHKSNMNISISGIIGGFLYYIVLLMFIVTAVEVLNMEAVSEMVQNLIHYIPSLLSGLLILIVGALLANYIKNVVYTACSSMGIPSAGIISNVVFYILFISVAMSALDQAQFETQIISNNLTIVLGGIVMAFAIGYGLASKQMVANQLNALYHKNEFEIGQRIKIGEMEGTIVEMSSNNVILESADKKIVIPFKRFSEENIIVFK